MAEIQMVQLKDHASGVSRKVKDSSETDFFGMLKEIGQSAPEKTVGTEESGKTTNQEKVQESDPNQDQVTDGEDKNVGQATEEGTDGAQESESDGLTGEGIAQLTAEMMVSLSQNAQTSQQQPEEQQQTSEGVSKILAGEESVQVNLADAAGELADENEVKPEVLLPVEDGGDAQNMQAQTQKVVPQQESSLAGQLQEQESTLQEKSGLLGQLPEQEQEVHLQEDSNIQTAAAASGAVTTENPSVHTLLSTENQSSTAVLQTSEETLPMDLSESIVTNMASKDSAATLELTLEPASLGKITIKMIYEDGKAALSLISDNPKTLEILSQKAGEIAQILQEKTGQDTVVYTPQETYPDQNENSQDGKGRQQEQRERPKQEHTDSFAQQLRLGLI